MIPVHKLAQMLGQLRSIDDLVKSQEPLSLDD